MHQLLSQRNLPFSDVSKYGLFLRNILISNIEQEIQQKCADVTNLHAISEKIKLQSSQSNENESVQRMLIQLKEQAINLNYSDLQIQIELALAQIEMIDSFQMKQNFNSFQHQKLTSNLNFQSISSLNHLEAGISQSIKEELITDNINSRPIFPHKAHSSKHSSSYNVFKENRSLGNIQEISQVEQQLFISKKEKDVDSSFNDVKKEYTESSFLRNQDLEQYERIRGDMMTLTKDEIYDSYMKKLMKFESNNGILITPYFKDKEQFFLRYGKKGVAIHDKLKNEDKQIICDLNQMLRQQARVAQLLELPHSLVSKISRSNQIIMKKEGTLV